MLGACAGDIIGSIYEGRAHKSKDFPLFGPGVRFTDDTVLTVATARVLLSHAESGTTARAEPDREEYARSYKQFGNDYPGRGYGGGFRRWLGSDSLEPYGSFGNGSAMRVAPVGAALSREDDVIRQAGESASASHDHTQGIRGAQALASAVFWARRGDSKEEIRREVATRYGYEMYRSVDEIRPGYRFDSTCQGSVPEALICFIESTSWEDAVRNAVSLGGDADTMADMAGAVAEAHYGGLPESVVREVEGRVDPPLLEILRRFYRRFGLPWTGGAG